MLVLAIAKLAMENKKGHEHTGKFWRIMVSFWSVILFAIIGFDFFSNGGYEYLISPICAIYVVVLSIFSTEKEFERWRDFYHERHPGEIYILFWTLLILFLIFANVFSHINYHIPSELISTYIVVLGILAITRKSRSMYNDKNNVC